MESEQKNIIEEFNETLRESAKEKFDKLKKEEGISNVVLYRFDFYRSDKEQVDMNNLGKIPQDNIEYFWFEYDKKGQRMKFALFFKDIDAETHNVHVIPGLFEEYYLYDEKENNGKKPDTPYAVVEEIEKTKKVVIKEVRGDYPSFAEPCDNGKWWVPTSECDCIKSANYHINKDRTEPIANFEDKIKEFRNFQCVASKNSIRHLKDTMGIKEIKLASVRTEKYKIICWYIINNQNYTMDLFKILYFPNFGFFTQYNCINFTGTGKDIVTNYPVVEKGTERDYNALKSPSSLPNDRDQIIELLSKAGEAL